MTAEGTRTHVPTAEGAMPAWQWLPASGSGPGLLLLQEIFGVSGYVRRRAAALADAGYVVVAPEVYWRLGSDVEPLDESAPGALEAAMGRMSALDWDTAVGDGVAAFRHVTGMSATGAVGVIGFCFGGGMGFSVAAVADPACLVSYYGSAIPGLLDLAPQVTAPSLHHFGLSDDYIDATTVDRIREAVTAAGADVRFETYPGANHAFDNDDFVNWHPAAAALAWERTLQFLAEVLPPA